MAKRTDLKKILVIGSGPIVIGQAAEFDYAGTQACLALKEVGYEVILINSNPATIMTDKTMADKVYMEPLTLEYISKIIRKERPDAIIPGLGGQTGLNMVVELDQKGVLEECQVEVLGTSLDSINKAEDRELFRQLCLDIDEPIIESEIAHSVEEAVVLANKIGYPIVLRPAFTLGGTGGGFAYNDEDTKTISQTALSLSPAHQVLVEKSLLGYKEIEFEVIRDNQDKALVVCDMENIDPVGIHTGDSIVVAPTKTLAEDTLKMLRTGAIKMIKALKIAGGCNIQYALDPHSNKYFVIEVNPRVSRSSALASKATSYPIARVTTLVAVGYNLEEIALLDSDASRAPQVDYTVLKVSRFPFDKFFSANRKLSTQMKATGEVMSIANSFEEALLKSLRSLEYNYDYLEYKQGKNETREDLLNRVKYADDERIYIIGELLRTGTSVQEICDLSQITPWFIEKINEIVQYEKEIKLDKASIEKAKKLGMSDIVIANVLGVKEEEIREFRKEAKIKPAYKFVDACNIKEFVPYIYSSYNTTDDNEISKNKKIIVLGSGPIRIGQGVEFDYSTVHCIQTIRKHGYEAIVINNNPETVSTDFTFSDKLYFEPITTEDVLNIVEIEKPLGVIVQLGGQTAINLANSLASNGVKILGTSTEAIDKAENRDLFEKLLEENNIKQPKGHAISDLAKGTKVANEIGYPVLVRPSFVLGGQSMKIVYNDKDLLTYLNNVKEVSIQKPILIDKYIKGKEVELDALCDGENILIPGIMEHIEKTGIHSGDSISVYPTFSIEQTVIDKIVEITKKIGLALNIKGLYNIQFIVDENNVVYIIEVNPRASRSVPFISKITNVNISALATRIMLGEKLENISLWTGLLPVSTKKYYVKAPTFSFSKISGLDINLGPEMKSTGEAIGYDKTLNLALYKALQASGMKIKDYGTIFITVNDANKAEMLPIAKGFYNLGFNIVSTEGTGAYLKENGMKVKVFTKISQGSNEILDWIKNGYIKYIINTTNNQNNDSESDGYIIRTNAAINNITTFTSLDTANVLLSVLEERGIKVDTI
ncbi:carbamoyl-phosphate synthase large subunit [Mycoplasma sp. P36-A1]|uniref:carbamoyl-phosphate synthase large subunit n=1 Tax=Mycoplasma sp. P36-A1 TaxID=3252900 RepID=UPI003C2EA6DE